MIEAVEMVIDEGEKKFNNLKKEWIVAEKILQKLHRISERW